MKKIVVSVFGKTLEEFTEMIETAVKYTDYFELRFDLCGNWKFQQPSLRSFFPGHATVIFTDRSPEKIAKNNNSLDTSEFELIDTDIIDTTNETEISADNTILSAHVFGQFSAKKINETLRELKKHTAKCYKIAADVHTLDDLMSLYAMTKNFDSQKWFVMGMGPYGKISRGIFAAQGFGTFSCLPENSVVAGQIDIITLKKLLS